MRKKFKGLFVICCLIVVLMSCILFLPRYVQDSSKEATVIKMSTVLKEDSEYINSIFVYQENTCQEVSKENIPHNIKTILKTISRKQQRLQGIDGALHMSVEDVKECLVATNISSSIFIESENQYILINLKDTYVFVLDYNYLLECDVMLIDVENQLLHWGRDEQFIGCLDY